MRAAQISLPGLNAADEQRRTENDAKAAHLAVAWHRDLDGIVEHQIEHRAAAEAVAGRRTGHAKSQPSDL